MAPQTNQPCLTVLGGSLAGMRFVIEDDVENILIGSDPSCTFRLELDDVSPIHARVWRDASGVTVYDTHSPKGLFVNDDRVNGQAPLRNGDILWLGSPGDETVVMIQCRLPVQGEASVEPEVDEDATGNEPTLFLPAGVTPQEPAPEVEAEPEPEPTLALPRMEEPPIEPTMVMSADEAPTAEGTESFFVEDEPFVAPMPPPPADEPDDEAPTRFTVDPPPGLRPVEPNSPPMFFEDETMETLSDVPAFGRPKAPQAAPPPTPPPAPTIRVAPPPPPPPAAPAPRPTAPRIPPTPTGARRAAPVPAVSRPARPAATAVAPRPRGGGGGGGKGVVIGVIIVGALALLAVGGGAYYWFVLKPGGTATTVAVTPAPVVTTPSVATAAPVQPEPAITQAPSSAPTEAPTEAPATVAPTEAPTAPPAPSATTSVRATPTPTKAPTKGTPAPTVPKESPEAQKAAQVALVLGQAEQAMAAQQYDTAVGRYDEVLRVDPQNATATAGRAKAAAIRDAAKRRFIQGASVVQSAKGSKGGDLSGFESADVKVAKAPDYSGRLDFDVVPANVKPGDNYTVKVSFTNDGKKDFKIGTVTITTTANGATSGGPIAGRGREVAPQGKVTLEQVPGVWQEGVASWRMEVVVTSTGGDSVKNQIVWK